MRRLHLFEVMDLPGCPAWLRRMETEYIQAAEGLFDSTAPVADRVAQALRHTGRTELVDLCSGAGGPILDLMQHLRTRGLEVRAVLTDRHPQPRRWQALAARSGGRLDFVDEPVDATEVPGHLTGLRTLFDGLHHLRPAQVVAVLADAVRTGMPLLALETTQRSWSSLATMALVPAAVWTITPSIRPLSLRRLAATYGVPLLPAVMTWDGVVSTLRTYTVSELRDFAAQVTAPGWSWDIGRTRHRGMPVSWMLGTPP